VFFWCRVAGEQRQFAGNPRLEPVEDGHRRTVRAEWNVRTDVGGTGDVRAILLRHRILELLHDLVSLFVKQLSKATRIANVDEEK